MPLARKLVFAGLDPLTNSETSWTIVEVGDIEAFDAAFDFAFASGEMLAYDLSEEDVDAIAARVGVVVRLPARVSSVLEDERLPQLAHTNRELLMMLRGAKPFAAFTQEIGLITEADALSGQPFDRHVADGVIVRRDYDRESDGMTVRRILFALPGEEWRFDEYNALMESASQGWDDVKERRQGELLGYTDWENDAHLARRRLR
ncbi:MAG TPA: hypothetical protein VG943_05935 [Caulobacterales bacterium]|nr:hypothetical protein [Caulobacterales bacterium]